MDVASIRIRLAAERERLEAARSAMVDHRSHDGTQQESTGELVAYDDNLADAATDTFDREVEDSVRVAIDAALADLAAAEARLDAGTYGRCEVCGAPIAGPRLAALPWASRCVVDQVRAEVLDQALRMDVLHGLAEAEAMHQMTSLPDGEAPEAVDVSAEEAAMHWEST